VIAEGAGALALAAGRRVAGKRKCAVVSGGNIDAAVLAGLLADVRPRAPRKPRRRAHEDTTAKAPHTGRTTTLSPVVVRPVSTSTARPAAAPAIDPFPTLEAIA
jgi:threonine dehydratase